MAQLRKSSPGKVRYDLRDARVSSRIPVSSRLDVREASGYVKCAKKALPSKYSIAWVGCRLFDQNVLLIRQASLR